MRQDVVDTCKVCTGILGMLIRSGDERTIDVDVRLAMLLAAVAGGLNAAGFQATGLFTANMTGNASALSDHLGLGQVGPAAFFGALVLAFVLGAFVSGLLIGAGVSRGVRAIYAYSITLEAGLLVLLGVIDLSYRSEFSTAIFVAGLSFIMGLQNAATTSISSARVRTTHVSGMATDIGLALASLVNRKSASPAKTQLLKLHTITMLSFIIGGVIGVVIYLLVGGWLVLGCGVLLFVIAVPQAMKAKANFPPQP